MSVFSPFLLLFLSVLFSTYRIFAFDIFDSFLVREVMCSLFPSLSLSSFSILLDLSLLLSIQSFVIILVVVLISPYSPSSLLQIYSLSSDLPASFFFFFLYFTFSFSTHSFCFLCRIDLSLLPFFPPSPFSRFFLFFFLSLSCRCSL